MAKLIIPYGLLEDGKYGIKLDDSTGDPLGVAVEVLATLPLTTDPDNYNGRMVFQLSDETLYSFQATPSEWFALKGIPVEVGNFGGDPTPFISSPQEGLLAWDRDTQVMFVYEGTTWEPVAGRFAATYVEQTSISTGFAGPGGDTFALGVVPGFAEFVEVFLDGVRQLSPGDYTVVGSNVVFPAPVAAAVEVFTRALVSTVLTTPGVLQNVQINEAKTTSGAGQTDFDTGAAGLDPAGTFVFLNGVLQCGGGVDYIHSSADTTINSITQVAGTATVTTASAHNASIGLDVTIAGALETDYNGTFTITATPTANTFEYAINPAAPAAATPNPILFYDPPFTNDIIIFTSPLPASELVTIRAIEGLVSAPSTGEANDGLNIGVGSSEDIFAGKAGTDLQFKGIEAGNNIQVLDLGTQLQISSDAGVLFESRNGINSTFYALAGTDSYIGVRNTAATVTIDVSTVPGGTSGSGRRVVITDESGGAGTNNILISHAGALFSGAVSPLAINVNYGSVTIVYDGTNWHVVSKTF